MTSLITSIFFVNNKIVENQDAHVVGTIIMVVFFVVILIIIGIIGFFIVFMLATEMQDFINHKRIMRKIYRKEKMRLKNKKNEFI